MDNSWFRLSCAPCRINGTADVFVYVGTDATKAAINMNVGMVLDLGFLLQARTSNPHMILIAAAPPWRPATPPPYGRRGSAACCSDAIRPSSLRRGMAAQKGVRKKGPGRRSAAARSVKAATQRQARRRNSWEDPPLHDSGGRCSPVLLPQLRCPVAVSQQSSPPVLCPAQFKGKQGGDINKRKSVTLNSDALSTMLNGCHWPICITTGPGSFEGTVRPTCRH